MSFGSLDIGASALYAQRVKMDTIANNIANVNTTRNPDGSPGVFRRKEVIFASAYNKALDNTNSASSNEEPEFDNQGQIILRGGINNDSPPVANGVSVAQISQDMTTPLKRVYNPSHPDADKDGYVSMPNINIVTEMVDMISASRAYEASISSIDATKSMISSALKI